MTAQEDLTGMPTPGLWRQSLVSNGVWREIWSDADINNYVARCFGPNASANAALIVKAVNGHQGLFETLQEIAKQAAQADDPEHHTLSLIKHMALNAIKEARSAIAEVKP